MERFKKWVAVACLLSCYFVLNHAATSAREQNLNDLADKLQAIKINKCCEKNEVMVDLRCTHVNETNASIWTPEFTSDGKVVEVKAYALVIGKPACESTQQWDIYHHDKDALDRLVMLPNGELRHYIHHNHQLKEEQQEGPSSYGRLHDPPPMEPEEMEHHYDYHQGQYCMDTKILTRTNETSQFAIVCVPEITINWSDTDYLLRNLLNPLFHVTGMICFLVVSCIYFILPTLRDLNGNIVTTINVCLIVSQAADCVKIFTQFSSHISFMVADVILYVSLLAAFFWLNSMGYYIWKTFKSRNVFLRVTDARKYCYYSCYAWGCTLLMAGLALFAHFMLEPGNPRKKISKHGANSFITNGDQETIGWLGIAVFFTPVAFTIIMNIFFYVTTQKVINRMNTYGRIHHKLKHNFIMFVMIFLIMTLCWMFLLMSWIDYDGLFYAHIIVNALQGPLFLYVCIIRQKHITFLLRKSCCYNEPVPTNDWGDEMTQMNGSSY